MLWLILRALLAPSRGDHVTITDTDTPIARAEIEAAIHGHVLTLKRMPQHWVDRRASIHASIDLLLDQWRAAQS